ncbi:VanZ family protein [Aliikangiella marina]|uniref:VanZ family protein n=1 Tax=Aliikangiella marina TaxID=1712262 RepID=A0A545TIJ0_9GAMM|nr:VanZ family protein [Aliikangiella marina]TQV77044.1 VanZ family protein [Aliikangiella marina]
MLKSLLTSYVIFWRVSFWVVIALLLYLTIIPKPPQPINLPQIDKIYHCLAFAGTTFLMLAAYGKLKHLWIVIIATTLGIVIEIIQYFVPGRGFSIADMLADFIGVLLGFALFKFLTK